MYTINPLMRPVLITTEEVLFHAPTKHTIDPRQIEQSIIIAEERFIRPELGFALYDTMALSKNVVVTGANIATLQAAVDATPRTDGVTPPILVEGMIVNALEQLSPTNQGLWKQYLWKLTAECVLTVALPEGFVQFSSEGAFHSVPPAGLMVTSGLVTPLLQSMKWSLDKKIQDRIAPLIQAMHNYLCKYKTDFPLYNSKGCPDCENTAENSQRKWAGLALGLYDEVDGVDEDERCCD